MNDQLPQLECDSLTQPRRAHGPGDGLPLLLVDACTAGRLCGVSRSHWISLHAAGRVPLPVRLGRCVRWRTAELAAWTAAGCPPRDRWSWPAREGGP